MHVPLTLPKTPLFIAVLLVALVAAACAPAATPTPTPAPTVAPTAEPTAAPTEEPTEAATEEPTEEVDAVATILADDADADATEAADDAGADATDDADADATEAADDADTDDEAGDDADAGEGFPGTVAVTTSRVRVGPSSRADVLVEITRDTRVVALGQTADQGYLYIRLEDGTEGWVAKQNITLDNAFAAVPVVEAP